VTSRLKTGKSVTFIYSVVVARERNLNHHYLVVYWYSTVCVSADGAGGQGVSWDGCINVYV
jgi:hypothetical protein